MEGRAVDGRVPPCFSAWTQLGIRVKQIRRVLALAGLAGIVAVAFAARMDRNLERPGRSAAPSASAASAAAAANTRVNGSQSLLPWGSLTVSGDVVELSTPDAPFTVTIEDGERSYLAKINGNGYTAVLGGYPPGSPDRMITVEVRSTRVNYVSVLGSRSRLTALAGADRFLTLQEQPTLRVSPYSTALAEMVKWQLDGREAANDAEFERAVAAVPAQDITRGAALNARVAAGLWPLTGNHADGRAMMRDRTLFRGYFDIPKDQESYAYLVNEAAFTPLPALSGLPSKLIMHGPVAFNDPQLESRYTMLLERQGNDTYEVSETYPLLDPRYSTLLAADGSVNLQPQGTISYQWGVYTRKYVSYRLRRLFNGTNTSHWAVRLDWQDIDPEGNVENGVDNMVMHARDFEQWRQPQAWSGVEQQARTLPWICADVMRIQDCGYAQYLPEGAAGGALVNYGAVVSTPNYSLLPQPQGPQPRFQPLTVDASGGLRVVNDSADTTFWRVGPIDAPYGTVVYKALATLGADAGKTMVGVSFTLSEAADPAMPSVLGTWATHDPGTAPGLYSSSSTTKILERTADNLGETRQYRLGAITETFPFQWQWWPERNAIVHQQFSSSLDLPNCQSTHSMGLPCTVDVTYFRPVRRVGARYFGVQETYQVNRRPALASIRTKTSRAAFYDCQSGPCLGAPAAMQRATFARPKRIAERAAFQR